MSIYYSVTKYTTHLTVVDDSAFDSYRFHFHAYKAASALYDATPHWNLVKRWWYFICYNYHVREAVEAQHRAFKIEVVE